VRWFAKRWLRGELLELEDGTTLHYPNDFTGPGYVLRGDEPRVLEGHVALGAWVFIGIFAVFFGPPKTLLEIGLVEVTGNSLLAWLVLLGLMVGAIALSAWLLRVRKERFLQFRDTRDPALWDEDLKRLATALEETKPPSFLRYFAALVAMGWGLGLILDILLMLVMA
jgi:hypothetical protein